MINRRDKHSFSSSVSSRLLTLALALAMLCSSPVYGKTTEELPSSFTNSNWYFYDNGRLVKDQWVKSNGNWRFTNSQGEMLYNTWLTLDGRKYYLDCNGYAICGSWAKIGGEWHYFDETCELADGEAYSGEDIETSVWFKEGDKWYYRDATGSVIKDQWINVNGVWYYMKPKGDMILGPFTWKGRKYTTSREGYVIPDSVMLK